MCGSRYLVVDLCGLLRRQALVEGIEIQVISPVFTDSAHFVAQPPLKADPQGRFEEFLPIPFSIDSIVFGPIFAAVLLEECDLESEASACWYI